MRPTFTLLAAAIMAAVVHPALAACDGYSLSGEAEARIQDGTITAITATGVSDVVGIGATALTMAMKAASLKARGALTRYFSQGVLATQMDEATNAAEVTNENNQTSTKLQTGERMVEIIKSQASNVLQGATNVAECYDADRKVAFVTVGVSPIVIKALNGFGSSAEAEQAAPAQPGKPPTGQSFERKSPNASLFQ